MQQQYNTDTQHLHSQIRYRRQDQYDIRITTTQKPRGYTAAAIQESYWAAYRDYTEDILQSIHKGPMQPIREPGTYKDCTGVMYEGHDEDRKNFYWVLNRFKFIYT